MFLVSQLYQSAAKEVAKINQEEADSLIALSRELCWGIGRTPVISDYLRVFSQNSYDNSNLYLGEGKVFGKLRL